MTITSEPKSDHYKNSGVDVAAGEAVVSWLQSGEQGGANQAGKVLSGIGGFASIFQPNLTGMDEPVLVSATDGVGTKIALAQKHDMLDGIGIDLVGMCVNDLYCIGARPLFFLDYYLTEKLESKSFKAVLKSIKKGLDSCQTHLIGGETAEHPGHFPKGQFDLAGFVVGIADKKNLISGPDSIKPGDTLFGFASSGFHSNGFSLIRKWLNDKPELETPELIANLLAPTKIYSFIPDLIASFEVQSIHGIAHITGGGFSGNIPRVMPKNTKVLIDWSDIPRQNWMAEFIAEFDPKVENLENTFNMGIGLTVFVADGEEARFAQECKKLGAEPIAMGKVVDSDAIEPSINFQGSLKK